MAKTTNRRESHYQSVGWVPGTELQAEMVEWGHLQTPEKGLGSPIAAKGVFPQEISASLATLPRPAPKPWPTSPEPGSAHPSHGKHIPVTSLILNEVPALGSQPATQP